MTQLPSHYHRLGLNRKASAEEIKQAYRRLIRDTHPDRLIGQRPVVMHDPVASARLEVAIAQAEYETRMLNEAYEVLSDPDKRRDYDGLTPAQVLIAAPAAWHMPPVMAHPHVYALAMALALVIVLRALLASGDAQALDLAAGLPTDAGAAVALLITDAQQAYEQGDLTRAATFYTQALSIAADADLYYRRGLVRLAAVLLGDDTATYQALADFDASLHHNPDHPGARLKRGLLLFDLWGASGDATDRDRAIADLSRYLDLAPAPDPAARHALSRLQDSLATG